MVIPWFFAALGALVWLVGTLSLARLAVGSLWALVRLVGAVVNFSVGRSVRGVGWVARFCGRLLGMEGRVVGRGEVPVVVVVDTEGK